MMQPTRRDTELGPLMRAICATVALGLSICAEGAAQSSAVPARPRAGPTDSEEALFVLDESRPTPVEPDVWPRLMQLEADVHAYRAENEALRQEVWRLGSEASHEAPTAAGSRVPLSTYWDKQLRFETRDKNWSIHVGGNLQWDSAWLIGPDSVFAVPGGGLNGTTNNPVTFIRRARFRFDGSIYQQVDYMLEFDLANAVNENKGLQDPTIDNLAGSPMPTNVWIQLRDFYGFGNVRIGQQVKPIGMTNNTSQTFLPFMERSYNMDAFYGPFDEGFTTGIMSINSLESGRITWRYGLFRPLNDTFGIAIGNWEVAGRVTALPIYEDDGRRLVHVGLGALYGDLIDDESRVRARPVLRNGPGYAVPLMVDTGEIPAKNHVQVGPEFAMVAGSLSLQAEYAAELVNEATVANSNQNTLFYHGGYCEMLYFLTGEHSQYDLDDAAFGRVIPRRNLRIRNDRDDDACGAWQAGLRFGYLDLNDRDVRGGEVYDWTLGLNWFLNPNTKIQFNYMLLHRDGQQDVAEGWINGFGTRAAVDF